MTDTPNSKVCPREPTKAMQMAGRHAIWVEDSPGLKLREMLLFVRKCWRAMYDAAPAPAQPCPDGDACPDARKYGSVHPAPAQPAGDLVKRLRANFCPGSDTDRVGDCLRRGDCGCTDGEAVQYIEQLEREKAEQSALISSQGIRLMDAEAEAEAAEERAREVEALLREWFEPSVAELWKWDQDRVELFSERIRAFLASGTEK